MTDNNVPSSKEVQSPLPETNSLGKPTTKLTQDWAEDLGKGITRGITRRCASYLNSIEVGPPCRNDVAFVSENVGIFLP